MRPGDSNMHTQQPVKDNYQYIDNKEYQAKFLLDPNIEKDSDFTHFDKNFAITNLKHNAKLGIDEPGEMRSILRGLHVLNNNKHYFEVMEDVLIGHTETFKDGKIFKIPTYEKRMVKRSKFPKTIHALTAEVISFVNTSAARNGHRIDKAITNKLVKEESISQKTEVPSKWGFSRNN